MPFDEVRSALIACLSSPVAVASVICLAGIHAAVWLLVFERIGFPTVLASVLLVPPFTFFLPFFLALTRWPTPERAVRFPVRSRSARPQLVRRVPQRQRRFAPQAPDSFGHHRPLRLDADGLPTIRIPLTPATPIIGWTARRELAVQASHWRA